MARWRETRALQSDRCGFASQLCVTGQCHRSPSLLTIVVQVVTSCLDPAVASDWCHLPILTVPLPSSLFSIPQVEDHSKLTVSYSYGFMIKT